ncbi:MULTISPECIES: SpoIIIAH-like family protein [unclassified Clostridium]|uniref:SpoIIIAH-like family protein n=1 Tax=unclassified Clostridium TaxID=2614128 RepID=UPI00023AFFAB|nr:MULTISPECIES: SpoIIIAH-like family protein [unclassified Clostridium]EHI99740.1 stage III sporulation protein AH [Clostridium sp. DL-VIII]OOM80015.1 stage III sporulation protein AH [Clostridium sp. BL-8]
MTKKQCGIIFTLLALILCVGMLAAKLNNGGLNDPTDLSQVLSADKSTSEQDAEALNQQNNFYDAKSQRDQQDSATIQTLNSIISDANTSKEQKDEATKELTQKTMTKDNEGRIELSIKNKGYEDALCRLDSNKATVIVKSATELQENETVAIQEIVQDISKIKDVIIQVQK